MLSPQISTPGGITVITVTFTATNVSDLCEQLLAFEQDLQKNPMSKYGVEPIKIDNHIHPHVDQMEFPIAEPKKRGRKKKIENEGVKIEATPLENDESVPLPEEVVSTLTRETVHQALQGVISSKSLETARAILSKFGVAKLSELPETKYSEFHAACAESTLG
jgi:hypothetical protein